MEVLPPPPPPPPPPHLEDGTGAVVRTEGVLLRGRGGACDLGPTHVQPTLVLRT